VRIDIHHHLLHNRRNAVRGKPHWIEKIAHKLFVQVANRPWLFSWGGFLFRRSLVALKTLPIPLLKAWLESRDLPKAPSKSFRQMWSERTGEAS